LVLEEGIREGKKGVIDKAYADYDETFPNRVRHEKRMKEVFDEIGAIAGDQLPDLKFRAPAKLFYPLFCALYHMRHGLPRLAAPRRALKVNDHAKIEAVLEETDELIDSIDAGTRPTGEDRKFFEAYDEHWVHA